MITEKKGSLKLKEQSSNTLEKTKNLLQIEKNRYEQITEKRIEYFLSEEIDKIAFCNSGEFKRYIGEILTEEDITIVNIGRTEEIWDKFEIKKNYIYIEFYGEEIKVANFIKRLEEDNKRFYIGEANTTFQSMGSKIILFKGRIGWLYKPTSKIEVEKFSRDEVFKIKEKNRRITGVRGGI